MKYRSLILFSLLLILFASSGASCPHMIRSATAPQAPIVFAGLPSRQQVINVVHANSYPIRQIQTTAASISVAGFPGLRASIYFQRPQNFRMLASSMLGAEMDLGSNNEMFWLWAKQSPTPSIYYSRHGYSMNSAASAILPVEPIWFVESFGLVNFDPGIQHEGPIPLAGGRLEMRSMIPSSQGNRTRVLIIDGKHGWILEHHTYDAQNRLTASAVASQHRFDPITGVSLPHHLDIKLPTAQNLSFQIDVANYEINQPFNADPQHLWQMPQIPGAAAVDLSDPRSMLPAANPRVSYAPDTARRRARLFGQR